MATLKSVTRAAEKLSLTQSAMSSRIAALEEELGVMLLDRRERQFRLTIAGMRFLVHAQRMLELQREAKAEMGSGTEPAVPLRLGAIESVLHSWLIPWIETLRAERPALALELTVETTPMLLEQMRRGTLDLAFAALPAAGEGVRTRPLPPMEMVFVGNAKLQRRARCSSTSSPAWTCSPSSAARSRMWRCSISSAMPGSSRSACMRCRRFRR